MLSEILSCSPWDPTASSASNSLEMCFYGWTAGEEGVKRANEKRFSERLSAQFEQYRQQRLANSEAECRKLISDITTRLTQVIVTEST